MAGIYGFAEVSKPELRSLLGRMTALLVHRGPDDAGHAIVGRSALGHRRLSIIDLSPSGHQPMCNDDRSVWIVYNGECYNYRELAKQLKAKGYHLRSVSDTEVILRLYEAQGEAGFSQLNGMFAFAIYDRRRDSLLLVRDRIGIKPLYYHVDSRRLLFASELKALLADPGTPTEVDRAALSDYLHLLSIPDPHSIFRGIKRLQPGHVLHVTPSGVEERAFWHLPVAVNNQMTFAEAVHGFGERFDNAVRSHMVADVPVGAFLSGGVDSSSIVARAVHYTKEPVETFSVAFPGLEEFDESRFAEEVARLAGSKHHSFVLTPDLVDALPKVAWHADEPFAISSAFALYFIAKAAREHVKVVLSGDGGDEVFAGYLWRHVDFASFPAVPVTGLFRLVSMLRSSPALARLIPRSLIDKLRLLAAKDERYLQSFSCFLDGDLSGLLHKGLADEIIGHWTTNAVQDALDRAPTTEQLARKLYCDVKTTLVSEMLTKADRMTMAHGLEARVPFLDHHLVEWAFTVPGRHKIRDGSGKALVKSAMEKYLPREILHRPKQGFNVPLKVWMRGPLKTFVRDSLSRTAIVRRGYFNPDAVERLLDNHEQGRIEASNKIFALLMLEIWHQQFVDRRNAFARAPEGVFA